MARIFTSGFETGQIAAEWSYNSSPSQPSIVTSPVRSGTYAAGGNTDGRNEQIFLTDGTSGPNLEKCFYLRFYFYVDTVPTSNTGITYFGNYIGSSKIGIDLNTDGALELWNKEDTVQIGSDSNVLDTDTWYRVELKVDTTTPSSTSVEAKLNGTTFASGTANLSEGVGRVAFTEGGGSGITYFDDFAINDDTGSYQNSWPGAGSVAIMMPDSAGDNAATSGTYADVNSIPPSTSSYIEVDSNQQYVDYNCESSSSAGIPDGSTINLVHVYFYWKPETSSESSAHAVLWTSSGGTQEDGTLSANDFSWKPDHLLNFVYNLTSYINTYTTVAWTTSDLDSIMVGVHVHDANPDAWFCSIAAMVEYIEPSNPEPAVDDTITITEDVTVLINEKYISVDDDITITEDVTVNISGPPPRSIDNYDEITITESVTVLIPTEFIDVYDSITITEDKTVEISAPSYWDVTADDTLTITEDRTVVVNAPVTPQPNVYDSLTITENVNVVVNAPITPSPSVDDSITITENVSLTKASYFSAYENLTITEDVTVEVGTIPPRNVSTYEDLTISEYVDVLIEKLFPTADDTLTITEDITVEVGEVSARNVSSYEDITITENTELTTESYMSAYESLTITEDVAVSVNTPGNVLQINIAGYTGVRVF